MDDFSDFSEGVTKDEYDVTMDYINNRKNVWLNTRNIIKSTHNYNSENIKFYAPGKMNPTFEHKNPRVIVYNSDALHVAKLVAEKKFNALVVFNSCYTNKGGGVQSGAFNDEANLCLRTNYRDALNYVDKNNYPLMPGSLIYAKKVTAFRQTDYNILAEPFEVDVLSVTFPKSTPITCNVEEIYAESRDEARVAEIFRNVFEIGKSYDAIIFNQIHVSQPIDGFLQIIKDALLQCPVSYVYFIVDNGNLTNKTLRTIFKKMRKLDNTGLEIPDCDSDDAAPKSEIENRSYRFHDTPEDDY